MISNISSHDAIVRSFSAQSHSLERFSSFGVEGSKQLEAQAGVGAGGDETEIRQVFRQFVGETLFGQMLRSMRKTLGKPAYFHGGRAEEVFQAQLDVAIAEKLSRVAAEHYADPMLDLFSLKRR